MQSIYGSCKRVVIWLGEQDSRTKSAVEGLEFMASKFDEGGHEQFHYKDWKRIKRGEKWNGPLAKSRSSLERPGVIGAFLSIFGRPWFTRVWIIQELLLGPDPLLMCGSFEISWETIEKAGSMSNVSFDLNEHLENLRAYRNVWRDPGYNLFGHMLFGWRNSVTDPRDKIYAYMGLVSDQSVHQIPVQVDYATDTEKVFTNFTIQYLSQTLDLGILSCCRGIKPSGLSWILNYDFNGAVELVPEDTFNWSPTFRAGGNTRCVPIFTEDNTLIGLQGHEIDRIACASPIPSPSPDTEGETTVTKRLRFEYTEVTNFFRLYLHARHICRIYDERSYQPTNESIREAFYRTLTISSTGRRFGFISDVSPMIPLLDKLDKIIAKVARSANISASLPLFILYCISTFRMRRDVNGDWALSTLLSQIEATRRRRFITTENGYIGLAPSKAEVGDRVVLIQGHKPPVVARRAGERWKLVGDCYLRGVMEGEMFNQGSCELIWFE
ncbi:hypothetical protein F5Y13DRAFT_44119 [Hypoxylon sp. FL1857]|nr:hypothetical protein F5Y13DRAFT_44119 [Hypoxylon sp. FL1857]